MSSYSAKAQPYLNAIADGVFNHQEFREWLIEGTPFETSYKGSNALAEEQRNVRWRRGPTKQPFWANYHCGRDRACTCRITDSVSLESDAVFYLRNAAGKTLAVHLEFKHKKEPMRFGQAEGYALRAECFRDRIQNNHAYSLPHDDWTTIIVCDEGFLTDSRVNCFQRSVSHTAVASKMNALGDVIWPA